MQNKAYIEAQIEANTKELLNRLPEEVVNELVSFAHSHGIKETDPSKFSTSIVDLWLTSVGLEQTQLSDAFPRLFNIDNQSYLWHPLSSINKSARYKYKYEKDEHEQNYARTALNEYISN